MKNICCFAGHGNLSYDAEIKKRVYDKARELVLNFGVNEFWVGNYGVFDKLAAEAVREVKGEYSDIELSLIIPYLTLEIKKYKELYYINYDNIIIAEIPAGTPKKYRILKCNRYMIDKSKYLIAYVNCPFGGAAKTLKYAEGKSHIEIFNFGAPGKR